MFTDLTIQRHGRSYDMIKFTTKFEPFFMLALFALVWIFQNNKERIALFIGVGTLPSLCRRHEHGGNW